MPALVVVIAILGISSSISLDRDYVHTKITKTLPLLSSETADSLVRIKANGFEFRARIEGTKGASTVVLLHRFPVTSAMWNPIIPSYLET